MNVNLSGLLRQAAAVVNPKKDRGAYAYMLGEVADHIDAVREGRITLDQLADHYIIRPKAEAEG